MHNGEGTLSRRVFIQLGAGTSAGLLLAACSSPHLPRHPRARPLRRAHQPRRPPHCPRHPPQPPQQRPRRRLSAPRQTARTPRRCRTTSPPNLLAKPDYDAHDPRVTLAWDNYPKSPPQSWNKPAPGSGSTVTAFAVDYYPPPTPLPDNATWQAVNKALNANVQMTQMTGSGLSAADGDA